jgi:hypothetical protein
MKGNADKLFELLPAIYRIEDKKQGFPLRALLKVIADQVDILEGDMDQLYDNWFIETCQDWVVPYIGDIIGYKPANEYEGLSGNSQILRREVANTIKCRRRKGCLATVEEIAKSSSAWPTSSVEIFRYLGINQNLRIARSIDQTQTPFFADLRHIHNIGHVGGQFDKLCHSIDIRRPSSHRTLGIYNIKNLIMLACRLNAYSATNTPARCREDKGYQYYTFSILGKDIQLFTNPRVVMGNSEDNPLLPMPIKRTELRAHLKDYYGEGKSLLIRVACANQRGPGIVWHDIEPDQIIVADMTGWLYKPTSRKVAIDPELGRIAFPLVNLPKHVQVSYHYEFGMNVGGGEYKRNLVQSDGASDESQSEAPYIMRVGQGRLSGINRAIEMWQEHKKSVINKDKEDANEKAKFRAGPAVIEVTDNWVYKAPLDIKLDENEHLTIRATDGARPIICLHRCQSPGQAKCLRIHGDAGSSLTFDGFLIIGEGIEMQGNLAEVTFRHSTIVPDNHRNSGTNFQTDRKKLVIELLNAPMHLNIDHCIILGSVRVNDGHTKSEARVIRADPISIDVRDSILDSPGLKFHTFGSSRSRIANAALTLRRSTIIGKVSVHSIFAENCIFTDVIKVACRQVGCMRFCYAPIGSRLPRSHNCRYGGAEPVFRSLKYGTSDYCMLADNCPEDIRRGADDRSEMGAFHNLYRPQREANLRRKMKEYMPEDVESSIIYVS